MKAKIIPAILLFPCLALLLPASLLAEPLSPAAYGFCQVNNEPIDLNSQLFMDLISNNDSLQIVILFTNKAGNDSNIDGIFSKLTVRSLNYSGRNKSHNISP